MKYIKTFEQFVNENNINELDKRFKPKKPSKASMPFFFQIFAREADKDGNREKHRVSVGKNDDYNEVKRQVLKDYPANKYYYTIWQNVRGGFKNIGTNESEESTEVFLDEGADMDKYFIVRNGFTFTTINNKKFTIPHKAEIEVTGFNSKNKSTTFKITKGKLDGYPNGAPKEFEIALIDFKALTDAGDIELNESVINEGASSVTLTTKDLSKLFGGGGKDPDTEEEIEDILERIGRIDSIEADSENQVNIEFERGFISINLRNKTITISQ